MEGRTGAAIVLAILATAALLWLAAEQHYQGCIDAATARTTAPSDDLLNADNPFADGYQRANAVRGCSRLPF